MIIYKNGKDKGLPNWRVSATSDNKSIQVTTENFQHGFRSGESFDKISTFPYSNSNHIESYVTILTKDPSKLEGYKPIVLDKLYEIVNHNISVQKSHIIDEEKLLKRLESSREMFKDRIREEKLNKIIDERD